MHTYNFIHRRKRYMDYRIERIELLQNAEATQIEGNISLISDANLQKISETGKTLRSTKASLERGETALLCSAPESPVFENSSGEIIARDDHSFTLSSDALQQYKNKFISKKEINGTSSTNDSLHAAAPIEASQAEPVVNHEPKKDLFEYNFSIACSDKSFRTAVGCTFAIEKTKKDITYGSWKQKENNSITTYTTLTSEDEPKRLAAKVASSSKIISISDVSVQPVGSGIVNEAYIPVMPAIQVGERLGFPTQGYYYHFNECQLVHEYKIIGNEKPAFYGTLSKHGKLSDAKAFNKSQSAILVHWKIHGKEISNQHLLYREEKLSAEEFAALNQDWLDEHGVKLDIASLLKKPSKSAQPSKQNFPPEEPATYNTPRNSYYSYPDKFLPGSAKVSAINSGHKIMSDITIVNLKPEHILRIGVFFDGTGNNRENDIYKEKYGDTSRTNVARLFEAYPEEPGKSAAIYVSGVGTVDNAWQTPQVIDEGDDCITYELATGVNPWILAGNTGAFCKWQNLLRALRRIIEAKDTEYSKVTHIAFDVFGFSRGAALARHFVNATVEGLPDYNTRQEWAKFLSRSDIVSPNNSRKLYKGVYPNLLGDLKSTKFNMDHGFAIDSKRDVSIRFVGLFDTVASFYLAGDDDEGDFVMKLAPTCAHKVFQLVAHHEYRHNFPLTSLKTNDELPENFYEEIFPGCHSDIGGGYPSKTQYDKKGLPERLGMPVQYTFNRELVKSISCKKFFGASCMHPEGPTTFWELLRTKAEEKWKDECEKKYNQKAEVKLYDRSLYYYRLQPISNGLAGLTLERMKQQAQLAGVNWKEKMYTPQSDYTHGKFLPTLWSILEGEKTGSITPQHWKNEMVSHQTTLIHRSHDIPSSKGYRTFTEWVSNRASFYNGSLKRNIFDNA